MAASCYTGGSGPLWLATGQVVVYGAGVTLMLQPGSVGGDLDGLYSQFLEIPEPFHVNDTTFPIKIGGRSCDVSPAACRVNQDFSVDDAPFMYVGVMRYRKVMERTGQHG